MDASKEIAEITEVVTVAAAIATFGSKWAEVSIDEIDDRAREIRYRIQDVMDRREDERNLYT